MADSYNELVKQMWRSSPDAPPTKEEWMEENAERALAWGGVVLRFDTPAHHVRDMLATDMLKQVE